MKILFFIFVLLFTFSWGLAEDSLPFKNSELPIDVRINDLLSRLTLEEKVALMLHQSPPIKRLAIAEYNWWNEALHGVGRAGKATVFPQAIGLAASFDNQLLHKVATAISDEARAKHHAALAKNNRQGYTGLSFWTPNINIFRDPRWGRGQETYGEDPYLTAMMGVAFVKGLQGNHAKYLKTSACAKHFAVHSGPEKLRHTINIKPDEKDLRETYLPAFKALVKTGVESVMCAYNRVNNDPCCGSINLLKTILRDEWRFKGHVVSDCWALDDIWLRHKVTRDKTEAAALAARAGVNLNCGHIYKYLPQAVNKGLIGEKIIDEILAPLLRTRFKLGLLDDPQHNPWANISPKIVNCRKHRDLAHEAAYKSMVLLKNNNTLPLKLDKIKKIFLTGPTMADNTVLLGNYNGLSGNLVTILEGILNSVDAGTIVDYRKGCLLNTPNVFNGESLAREADVTIAALGLSRLLEGEEGDAMLSGHGGDRQRIRLPKNQIEYVKRLRKHAGTRPLIVIITGGSAIAIPEILKLADAVLYVWYPGEQGGNGVADIIFGKHNPAGRLPVTFYKSLKDLPSFADYSMTNRTYRYFRGTPLFPFGHGLSYTTFKYSRLKTDKNQYNKTDKINLTLAIQNIGHYKGDEVVQLYIKQLASQHRSPIKSLRGFQRIHFNIGESKQIQFQISVQDLTSWDLAKRKYKIQAGRYEIQIGSSSADIRLKKTITIR